MKLPPPIDLSHNVIIAQLHLRLSAPARSASPALMPHSPPPPPPALVLTLLLSFPCLSSAPFGKSGSNPIGKKRNSLHPVVTQSSSPTPTLLPRLCLPPRCCRPRPAPRRRWRSLGIAVLACSRLSKSQPPRCMFSLLISPFPSLDHTLSPEAIASSTDCFDILRDTPSPLRWYPSLPGSVRHLDGTIHYTWS